MHIENTHTDSHTRTYIVLSDLIHVFAAHCITLQHTATHCNVLQHTATHCNTLQHAATHCDTLLLPFHVTKHQMHIEYTHTQSHMYTYCALGSHSCVCITLQLTATHCNTLQHTATHCNTLQHTATHCSSLQHAVLYERILCLQQWTVKALVPDVEIKQRWTHEKLTTY